MFIILLFSMIYLYQYQQMQKETIMKTVFLFIVFVFKVTAPLLFAQNTAALAPDAVNQIA